MVVERLIMINSPLYGSLSAYIYPLVLYLTSNHRNKMRKSPRICCSFALAVKDTRHLIIMPMSHSPFILIVDWFLRDLTLDVRSPL